MNRFRPLMWITFAIVAIGAGLTLFFAIIALDGKDKTLNSLNGLFWIGPPFVISAALACFNRKDENAAAITLAAAFVSVAVAVFSWWLFAGLSESDREVVRRGAKICGLPGSAVGGFLALASPAAQYAILAIEQFFHFASDPPPPANSPRR